jgi:hypothetical protein
LLQNSWTVLVRFPIDEIAKNHIMNGMSLEAQLGNGILYGMLEPMIGMFAVLKRI